LFGPIANSKKKKFQSILKHFMKFSISILCTTEHRAQ
jgi:hypothetical protein